MLSSNVSYFRQNQLGLEFIYISNAKISYPEHNHISVYTVGLILEGDVFVKKKDRLLHCKPDMMYVIFPYEPHSIYSENNYSMASVCINKNFIHHYCLDEAKMLFEKIFWQEFSQANISLHRFEYFYKAFDAVYMHEKSFGGGIKDKFIEMVKKHIEDYPENRLSLEQISQIAYTGKYHLLRKFKEEVGLTPHKFQIQNQVRKAQRLLEDGLSIAEVALAAGFCDQSHLIKRFRGIVGITPSEYKAASIRLVNAYSAKSGKEFCK